MIIFDGGHLATGVLRCAGRGQHAKGASSARGKGERRARDASASAGREEGGRGRECGEGGASARVRGGRREGASTGRQT